MCNERVDRTRRLDTRHEADGGGARKSRAAEAEGRIVIRHVGARRRGLLTRLHGFAVGFASARAASIERDEQT
jgi:hypothetical protein